MLVVLDMAVVLLSLASMLCLVGLLIMDQHKPHIPSQKNIALKDAATIYYVQVTTEHNYPLFVWWINQFILPFVETQPRTILVLCIPLVDSSVPEWLWFHPSIYIHRYTQHPLSTLSLSPSCTVVPLQVFDILV